MAINLDAIRAKLNKLQSQTGRQNNLWKPEPGNQQIRIVPYQHDKDNPFLELYFHYDLGEKNYLSPVTFGKAAERIERARQQSGSEMNTWEIMKAVANTPAEKKEIRETILRDYKKNGAKNMAEADLKWIGKSRVQNAVNDIKIDIKGISDSINTYINATKIYDPVPPPPKKPDSDLNGGLAAILGEPYEN